MDAARRKGDLTRVSQIMYEVMPALERKLAQAQIAETKETQLVRNKVTEEEIAEVVSKWTGIPVSKMLEGEKEKLLRMEEALSKRVVGQDEAVKIVSNAIRRSRAGLADPSRPNGSFLFLGPTGVGKTELCKALAEFLFDTEESMVRIDMSEFMEKHSVSRLIGAPPGYVGYDEGGQLTEAVRRRPYAVILLDEVEKAHPDVFNVLLQVLDDGRLTDGQGRTVDFRNTVIIMTSNLGSDVIQQFAGEGNYAKMKAAVMEVVQQNFRPEFINRIDDICVFHPLGTAQIRVIVDIQLAQLKRRLLDRNIELVLDEAARDKLGEAGYDPVYGARPLKRAIQQQVENPLAQAILSGKFLPGDRIRGHASTATGSRSTSRSRRLIRRVDARNRHSHRRLRQNAAPLGATRVEFVQQGHNPGILEVGLDHRFVPNKRVIRRAGVRERGQVSHQGLAVARRRSHARTPGLEQPGGYRGRVLRDERSIHSGDAGSLALLAQAPGEDRDIVFVVAQVQ